MPTIVDLPKRQRSGAFKFSDDDLKETLTLLSQAKTGQAVIVTDEFAPDPNDGDKAEIKARNVASGRNNTIREALEAPGLIDDGYHVKMHVVRLNGGYAGAVSLRKGPKPERKPRTKKADKKA